MEDKQGRNYLSNFCFNPNLYFAECSFHQLIHVTVTV